MCTDRWCMDVCFEICNCNYVYLCTIWIKKLHYYLHNIWKKYLVVKIIHKKSIWVYKTLSHLEKRKNPFVENAICSVWPEFSLWGRFVVKGLPHRTLYHGMSRTYDFIALYYYLMVLWSMERIVVATGSCWTS